MENILFKGHVSVLLLLRCCSIFEVQCLLSKNHTDLSVLAGPGCFMVSCDSEAYDAVCRRD